MSPRDPAVRFTQARRRLAALAALLVVPIWSYAVLATPDGARPPTAFDTMDRSLTYAALVAITLLGVAAAIRRPRCPGKAHRGVQGGRAADHPQDFACRDRPPWVAHHCSCGLFADHVIRFRGRPACAGCSGMVLGGCLGLGLATGWTLAPSVWPAGSPRTLALVGGILVLGGLVGSYPLRRPPRTHVLANAVLVVGLVGLVSTLSDLSSLAGALGIALALAVVGLRAEMSRLLHVSVYLGCPRNPWAAVLTGSEASARVPTHR